MRVFMGMQGYEHLSSYGRLLFFNKPHKTPGLYAIAFLIAISGARQFPADNKRCFLRI